jgi:DNA-directed RNA polymerase subunit alpha
MTPDSTLHAGTPGSAVETQPEFDLLQTEKLSFAALQSGRIQVFRDRSSHQDFVKLVDGLPNDAEQGRRKGLGLWILGRFTEAAALLSKHAGDDVADFTRGHCLMASRDYAGAAQLFERLTKSYPEEPRPRGAAIDARVEELLAKAAPKNDPEAHDQAALLIEKSLKASPESFIDSAEGQYLSGRRREFLRDPQGALEHYQRAREYDPTLRANLVRAAYVAERGGLDLTAIEIYESLVALRQADRGALLNLGVLYEDHGRDAEAASCYDIVLKQDPTDTRARLYLIDAQSAIDMYYDEDQERKEDKLNQILRTPISDFELSVRARNCLNKMQIHTLGDLVTKSEQELLSYKNFGETSLNEIKEILRTKGLRLGMPREEAVASIESRSRRPGAAASSGSDTLNKPIADLQLSIRARRTVEGLGCLTVGDIVKHSAEELLGMPNFGTTSLQELRSKLSEMGLKLAGE